jgi:signal transduction histidine kinase
MQQVILNLFTNAIQALNESVANPKILCVESRYAQGGVEILISDNGSGIPAEMQDHLFELLSDSNKRSGMGLGLWLCHHIVSRHGGHIRYQDAPSGGAQFIVFLPAAQA